MRKALQKIAQLKQKIPVLFGPVSSYKLNTSQFEGYMDYFKKDPLHKKRENKPKKKDIPDKNKEAKKSFKELYDELMNKKIDDPFNEPVDPENENQRKKAFKVIVWGCAIIITGFIANMIMKSLMDSSRPSLSYELLEENLKKRTISQITIVKRIVKGIVQRSVLVNIDKDVFSIEVHDIDAFLGNIEASMKVYGYSDSQMVPIKYKNTMDSSKEFHQMILTTTIITLSFFLMYKLKTLKTSFDNMIPSGKKVAKTFEIKKLNGGFDTIAGLDSAKLEIKEFVEFLKNPFMFASLGAKMPKGALLTGLPGTGKTLLAKACAYESGVSFFSVSGSDFVEKYVGIGASNVRKLFDEAKKKAPSVIFIDEIDAIGKKRDEGAMMSNSERENTLNQLLVEMDGFDSKTSIIVLAATNRPNILDPALTRPGRLDRHIALTLPDLPAREKIFLLYLQKLQLEENSIGYLAKRLATLSPGFSGADIANLCNEGAILAAREEKDLVSSKHFEEAAERVIAGLRRHNLITEEEKHLVSIHESGHATASWFLAGADPLVKVTIVPRSKGALGFAQYLVDDNNISTKNEMMDKIVFILGGRVAEELFFNKISTGAQDDLQKAFDIAQAIVTSYGMIEEFAYVNLEGEGKMNSYIDRKQKLLYSDETQNKIDAHITNIIEECYQKCRKLLNEKRNFVEALSKRLMENESVNLKDLIEIFGQRPFAANSNFDEYLKHQEEISPIDNK
jgi:AFG3 family protein